MLLENTTYCKAPTLLCAALRCGVNVTSTKTFPVDYVAQTAFLNLLSDIERHPEIMVLFEYLFVYLGKVSNALDHYFPVLISIMTVAQNFSFDSTSILNIAIFSILEENNICHQIFFRSFVGDKMIHF